MTAWTQEQKQEHRRELAAALRSGKYSQTTNVLRDSTGFCCLGVACEISGVGKWTPYDDGRDVRPYIDADGMEYDGVLPLHVMAYYGIATENGELGFEIDDEAMGIFGGTLSSLNDNGATFEQIAEMLEGDTGELFDD